MARGGKRSGAGRPVGAKAEVTQEAIRKAGAGETPLEYMLRVMRDPTSEPERRDKMAVGAAPYVHMKMPVQLNHGDAEGKTLDGFKVILVGKPS